MENGLLNWWNGLSFKWKKYFYLNHQLSLQTVDIRIAAFLDDSYGLDFVAVKFLGLESQFLNDDLVRLNKHITNALNKIDVVQISELLEVSEFIVQNEKDLNPLRKLKNLKVLYLDHVEIANPDILRELNVDILYESMEYPTNKPTLESIKSTFAKTRVNEVNYDMLIQYFNQA